MAETLSAATQSTNRRGLALILDQLKVSVRPISPKPPSAADGNGLAAPGPSPQFESTLESVRDAMMALVAGSPVPVRRAVDLQKSLGLHAPLAWRIFKIASVTNPLEVVKFAPSPGETARLLQTAELKGVSGDAIAKVRDAMDAYNKLLQKHATSRESFRAMVASVTAGQPAWIDEKTRKTAFQSNALIWGTQCDVSVGCLVVHVPPGAPKALCAGILGMVGMHDIRPSTEQTTAAFNGKVTEGETELIHTFDDELLHEFCTAELDVSVRDGDMGFKSVDVKFARLGRQAAVNVFQLFTSEFDIQDARENSVEKLIQRPTAMVHMDLMVPAIPERRIARGVVYGQRVNPVAAWQCRPADEMPVETSTSYLGAMSDAPPAPDVPRYTEMVRKVLEHQGWYGTKYDVYRCRLPYPILHSMVGLQANTPSSEDKARGE